MDEVVLMACETVRIGPLQLPGEFEPVAQPVGMVVCARGGGSQRERTHSRRQAAVLRGYGLGTLRIELLTRAEAEGRRPAVELASLAGRLGEALDWIRDRPELGRAMIGLFGASTGAVAALLAAAEHPGQVAAVAAQGGRPDVAAAYLGGVQAPTLLIVGANDSTALDLNRDAMRRLHCNKRLEIVPGAGPLFEEPGALDAVAQLAGAWFANYLSDGRRH